MESLRKLITKFESQEREALIFERIHRNRGEAHKALAYARRAEAKRIIRYAALQSLSTLAATKA